MHIPPDDVCLNKAAIIERALRRIQEEFAMDPGLVNYTHIAFRLLKKANILSAEVTKDMVSMTGFRNVAIHEYQELDLAILKYIAEKGWHSLVSYCSELGLKINPDI